MIGGFSGKDLKRLTRVTVRLQVSRLQPTVRLHCSITTCKLISNSNWTEWSTIQGVIERVI